MKKPILVVMAAGMGSRFGGLKQISPVGPQGEIIMDYSLFDARRAGFETVVFIIKREIEADFKAVVDPRAHKYMKEVRYAFQQLDDLPEGFAAPEGRAKPWGTAHAVYTARGVIDAPFAVINADDYYGPAAFAAVYNWLAQHGGEAGHHAMVGYLLKNTVTENGSVARGICVEDESNMLASVTERTCIRPLREGIGYSLDGEKTWHPLNADAVVSMNLWGFAPDFVAEIEARMPEFLEKALAENPLKAEFYLPGVVSALLAEQKADVKVLRSPDKWYGVTYKEDAEGVSAALAEMAEAGLYPAPLWGE